MKAVIFDQYGGPETLKFVDIQSPIAGPEELLVQIHAIGVNPADYKWRAGAFRELVPLSFPYIGGYDFAGEVTVDFDGIEKAIRVVGMLDNLKAGAYAEFVAATKEQLVELPDNIDYATAAAVPTPGLTGAQLIEDDLDVQSGERVLITGAIGAVGRFAMHAAKERKAHVVAAVRSSAVEMAWKLGADEVVVLGEATATERFDKIGDTVGGHIVADLFKNLRPGGLIRTVATAPVPPDGLPETIGFVSVQPNRERLARVIDWAASGEVPIDIAECLALSDAAKAHSLLEAGQVGGKIILDPIQS